MRIIYQMSYIVSFSLLIVMCLCSTDLTLLNCASNYLSVETQLAQSSSFTIPKTFYSTFSNIKSQSRSQKIIQSGDTQDLKIYMKQLSVPYIVFSILIFIVYITAICCCIFDTTCPPCKALKRNRMIDPYKKSQLRCSMVFTAIFSLSIISLSLYSLSFVSLLKTNMDATKCSLYVSADTALNGDTTQNWGGFEYLKTQVGNISSLISSATTQISTYLPGDEFLVNDMSSMKQKNINIYKQYKNSRLITTDPVTTGNTIPGDLLPRIDSVFIKTGMGPAQANNTMTYYIDIALKNTQILTSQGYKIVEVSKQLVQSSATIQANTIAAQSALAMYITQLKVVSSWLDAFTGEAFQNSFSQFLYLLQITVGILLGCGFLVFIGMVGAHSCSMFKCRQMVHFGWIILGLSISLVLTLLYATLSAASVGYHTCNYFQSMLTNVIDLNRLRDYSSQNVLNRFGTCLYEDGNSLKIFGINNQMQTVSDLFSNIATFYEYDNSTNPKYINKTIPLTVINGWIAAIEKYRLGIYKDTYDSETANSNPNYAIEQLNLYSYQGGGVKTCSKDRWVFDQTNCTNPTETNYTATASNGTNITTNSTICISFNDKLSTLANSSWTQSEIRQRYIQIRQQCPDAYKKIIEFTDVLINYRDSRVNLFQNIKQDLQSLLTLNSDYNRLVEQFRGRVDQLYASLKILNNLMTSQSDGLKIRANCTVLKRNLQFVYNSFCGNFLNNTAQLGICVLILVFLAFGAMFSGCMFGIMYSRVQRDHHLNQLQDYSDTSIDHKKSQPNLSQEEDQEQ